MLQDIKAESLRDLLGEGIKPDGIEYSMEVEVSVPGKAAMAVEFSEATIGDGGNLRASCEAKTGVSADKATIELLRAQIRKAMPKPALVERPMQGADSARAIKGTRKAAWGSSEGKRQFYNWELWGPGNAWRGARGSRGPTAPVSVPKCWP